MANIRSRYCSLNSRVDLTHRHFLSKNNKGIEMFQYRSCYMSKPQCQSILQYCGRYLHPCISDKLLSYPTTLFLYSSSISQTASLWYIPTVVLIFILYMQIIEHNIVMSDLNLARSIAYS